MPGSPSRLRIAFDFAVITLIWSSTWLVIKDQIAEIPPSWTVTWRLAVASCGMIVLARLRRESLLLPAPALRLSALIGLGQFCINFQMVYRAELHLASGVVAVIFALLLVPNALLGRLFLGERLNGRFLAGSAVATAGIALLMIHEFRLAPDGDSVPLGLLLAFGGLMGASIGSVLQATDLARSHPIVPQVTWAMIFATATNAALAMWLDGPPVFDPRPAYLAGIAYLGLIGSVVTFPLYFGLVRTIGAGPAAYSSAIIPVIAMGLSTLFEGYRWTWLAASGASLVIAGLLVALSGRSSTG